MPIRRRLRRKGSALLVVLWLAAALSAIAFSLARTVRSETERTSTALDGVKSYYLATGAIERAVLYMQWGPQYLLPDGSSRYYSRWMPSVRLAFPAGEAVVDILPETSKLNINQARPEDLLRLLLFLGVQQERANEIVSAILDWRMPRPEGDLGVFDRFYLAQVPSFRARHASFQEIEELLLVKGMTPELFYGAVVADPRGRLARRTGLKDCLSVWGSANAVDVNTAPPAVLAAIGLSQDTVTAIAEARRHAPFRSPAQIAAFRTGEGPAGGRLGIGGNSIYTLKATARLRLGDGRLSDLRRTVAATLQLTAAAGQPYTVLRWQENAWSE